MRGHGKSAVLTSQGLLIVAATVVGLAPLSAVGQVSMEVLSSGANSATVTTGPVSLALSIQVTSSVGLSGVQFALIGSDPELFEYADNSRVHGSPFTAGDVVGSDPAAGTLVSTLPQLAYFSSSGDYPASSFPSVISTLNLRSVGTLAPGTYTFTTGASVAPHIWTNEAGSGTFDSAGTFTLTVESDGAGTVAAGPCGGGTAPAAGVSLLALLAVQTYRRRRF